MHDAQLDLAAARHIVVPGALDATGRRLAHMPAAVLGNGSLLATLSGRGELERLFWPHVDWGQHLGELRLGVASTQGTRWLDEPPFLHQQAYLDDQTVLRTIAADGDTEIEITDFVAPDRPLLVRTVSTDGDGLRLVVYCRPEFDESCRYGTVYRDPITGALVFYRRDTALALSTSNAPLVACGRVDSAGHSYVLEAARAGKRDPYHTIEYGHVDGSLSCDLDPSATLLVAFGHDCDEALEHLADGLRAHPEALLRSRLERDGELLANVAAPLPATGVPGGRLYRRSVLLIDQVTDRETGATVAAPEMDSDGLHSGGYGFVWARDLAYTVLAFLASGQTEPAARALRWLAQTQSRSGIWLHRHWTSGALAPSWGLHQLDETGTVLFAINAYAKETDDVQLDRELWPAVRKGADALLALRDPTTRLTVPSVDLWEERVGEHAYTAAACYAGLDAAAQMAARHEPARASLYGEAAAEIRCGLDTLWNESSRHYLRTHHAKAGAPALAASGPPATLPYPNRPAVLGAEVDSTVDASLLGLAWPFAAVDPASERMRATARAIEAKLRTTEGGLLRYEGDEYAGGNAWILTTLWLGLWHRQIGDTEGWHRCVEYAINHRTGLGLLPEQVTRDGQPAWVLPLTWSHAMFIIAVTPEIDAVQRRYTASTSAVVPA